MSRLAIPRKTDEQAKSVADVATNLVDRYTLAVIESQHALANEANRHLVRRLHAELIDKLVNGLGYRQ